MRLFSVAAGVISSSSMEIVGYQKGETTCPRKKEKDAIIGGYLVDGKKTV